MSEQLELLNPRAVPGGNNPPPLTAIEASAEINKHVSAWMADHHAIISPEQAQKAAELDKVTLRARQELDAERDGRVRPFNERVAAINAEYRSPLEVLKKIREELQRRLSAYMQREEARRREEAAEAQRRADEAARLAREAQDREREALENAASGEIGIDIGEAIGDAEAARQEAERLQRVAAIAEKDTPVRIGTGFGAATALRAREELTVTDPGAAIAAIGLTEKIAEAIKSAARDYRRLKGALPAGVVSNKERTL